MKSGRTALRRAGMTFLCTQDKKKHSDLRAGLFANKISSSVKRSRSTGRGGGSGGQRGPTRGLLGGERHGNMTRRYSVQVAGACLEFGVSTTLKVSAAPRLSSRPFSPASIPPRCPRDRAGTRVSPSLSLCLSARTPLR